MSKINVVSLFSGGGGLDLGFMSAGYNIIWAIDNNKNAVETYKKNIGNHIILEDINKIDLNDIPKADVIIGGPPCQSFSLAGKRNVEDSRGRLVWRYLDIIKKIKPKAFVFENVTGLMSAKNTDGDKIVELLQTEFKKIDYKVSLKILNAADYGVPQKRRRVIIVGLNNNKEFSFPVPKYSEKGNNGLKKYISVEEALGDLPSTFSKNATYRFEPVNEYQKRMRKGIKNDTIHDHDTPQMSELDTYIVKHVKPGGNYMDIPKSVKSKRIQRLQRDGGHTTCYGRMSPDSPSYTINTYFNRPNVGCNIHYKEDRLITVREALRLQSFPDWYELVSSTKQGKNMIVGNAVPPILAEAVALELKNYLESD